MGTEQEIFDSALEDEAAAAQLPDGSEGDEGAEPPAKAEQAAGTPPKGDEQPPAASAAAQAQDQQPQAQHFVPLKELLDTRERAQAAEREREDLRRALEQFQRQQAQARQEQKPPQAPDIFADPEGYTRWLQEQQQSIAAQVRMELRAEAIEASCDEAAERHGKLFEEAFEALIRTNDPVLRDRLTARPHRAGEAIVQWYKQQQVLREVGSDPAAYRQKLAEELLNDEAFLAKAVEKLKGASGAAPTGPRPQNVTRLPSLNRQTSAAAMEADDGDDSEEAIWAAGSARRRA